MEPDRQTAGAFMVSLTAAIDAARECGALEPENLIHFGLGIPESWRSVHEAFAHYYGLWWRPCPLCGAHFGAHEHDDEAGALIPFSEEAVTGNPLLARCAQRICRACARPGRIERLAELAARGKMTDDEAVRWAARIYPDGDGSEGITREAIKGARAAMMAG